MKLYVGVQKNTTIHFCIPKNNIIWLSKMLLVNDAHDLNGFFFRRSPRIRWNLNMSMSYTYVSLNKMKLLFIIYCLPTFYCTVYKNCYCYKLSFTHLNNKSNTVGLIKVIQS